MGSRRSRRVSWATGPSLCKVRLFISEDSPSQAGLRPQDNLQAKGSTSLMHAAGPSSDDSLPPGFESLQPANDLKIDISQIPLIGWKCPPHILLNPDWQLASGQESREIPVQNERMFGVLEAIYPRASNIPPNPFVSLDVKDAHYDDSGTPLVPVIPVEDDDASDQSEGPMVDPPNDAPQVSNAPITAAQQHPHGSTGVEPDVLAAASAAYTAIMQSNQKGSMVDRDLLVKILSDPVQVERLMKEYNQIRQKQSTSSSVVAPMPSGPPPQMTMSAPASYSNHITTFQNTNSALPPPLQMAPRPMMNRLPQGYPPVPMNHPPGSSPAINLRPGSSPAMSRPPGPNLAMSRPPGLNPAMSRPPGPNPAMSHPPGPNPAMSHPPGPNPATGHPPGSNPAMSHPSGSNPAMSHPPGSNLATSYPPGSSSPAMNFSGAPPRAINYYKTLIHQHGGERQESLEQHGRQFGMYPQSAPPQTSGIDAVNGASVTNRDMKTRPTRPCAYFNGPRGCRNGANCTFLHDSSASSRQQEQQNGSKRLKLDSGIAGRN